MTAQSFPLSRREFLYYVWAASMALFTLEGGGAVLWYALPRFRPGEFGGTFTVAAGEIPAPDDPPKPFDAGRFWLVHVGPQAAADPRRPAGHDSQPGLLALYKVCVHLGCLYRWIPSGDFFECPCHFSRYLKDGTRVRHPATRDLDRFIIQAVDEDGSVLASTPVEAEGAALRIPEGTAAIVVDTGKRIRGRRNDGPATVP